MRYRPRADIGLTSSGSRKADARGERLTLRRLGASEAGLSGSLTSDVALRAIGLDALIISAQLATPYRQEGGSGKDDAHDAAAVSEAGGRPRVPFVPVKSVE